MKVGTVVASMVAVALVAPGCDPMTRYRVLSFLFDAVPPPQVAKAPSAKDATGAAAPVTRVTFNAHGPYGAKLCNACHNPGAFNALVLPREELCFKCHEFKLDKKYIHGPLASGGCTACHDPHSSKYRYLLRSESDTFCLYCHDRQAVAANPAHASAEEKCTACHDPHMSDRRYLLR